jgi:hypothetical protein
MELIVFNKLNSFNSGSRKPKQAKIRVSKSLGIVYLNATALDIMGLKVGDFVEFCLDTNKPVTWYIRATDKERGLAIAKYSTSGKVSSKKIADAIIETYSPKNDSPAFPLSSVQQYLEENSSPAWCIVNKLLVDAK